MAFRIPMHMLQVFIDQGLAPKGCRSLELFIPADGALVLRSEVFVERDHVTRLSAAFAALDTMLKADQGSQLTGGSS